MSVIKLTREINGLIWASISRLAKSCCEAGEEGERAKASYEVMYLLSWDDLHALLPISAHLWICVQTRRDWTMHSGDILDRYSRDRREH